MSPLYDFSCRNGHTTEKRTNYSVEFITCPLCGEFAERESVYYNQSIVTETGSKPSQRAEVPRDEKRYNKQYKRFQEASAEIDYQHTKKESELGIQLPSKPLWKEARRKARRIKSGQEPPLRKGT